VAPEPAPVAQVATALGPHEHNLKVGIVAYDRCEGLPQNPGRFPCPRDLALEQYVWRSLRGLEHCAVAKDALGSGEIKLEFAGSRLQSVRINKPKRDGLDRDVVSKCAGGALAAARTAFSPEQMLVRFRFELR
jgi:hypothetical protein